MATSTLNLNQGPPLPPNLQPPPQASVSQLAGGQQADPSGSAALQKAVIEKLMFSEQAMTDAGKIMPSLAPIMQGVIDSMRKQVAGVMASPGAVAPPPVPGAGGGLMAGPQTMSNPTA